MNDFWRQQRADAELDTELERQRDEPTPSPGKVGRQMDRVRKAGGRGGEREATPALRGAPAAPSRSPAPGKIFRRSNGRGVRAGADGAVSRASASSGQALPGSLRSQLERFSGASLDGVRVHTGSASAQATQTVGARAYAQEQSIHFAAGTYDPASKSGQELIAHEVAHTIQQRSGAAVGRQNKLAVSSVGDSHEREADAFASAFVGGQRSFSIRGAAATGVLHRQTAEATESEGQDSWTSPQALAGQARGSGAVEGPQGETIAIQGPANAVVGATVKFSINTGDESATVATVRWYCVNDPETKGMLAPDVHRGPSALEWEANFDFPGQHVIVAEVADSDGNRFGVAVVQSVGSVEQRLDEAATGAEALSYETTEAQMLVQESMAVGGTVAGEVTKEDGTTESIHVVTSSDPNPAVAPAEGEAPRHHTYRLTRPDSAAVAYRWYAVPRQWDVMPSDIGLERTQLRGRQVYVLGEGTSARFPIVAINTYDIFCEEIDAQGNVIRSSSYFQNVVDAETAGDVQEFREHQEGLRELAGTVVEREPVTGVILNEETGQSQQLNLFLGKRYPNDDSSSEIYDLVLIDLTPGVQRREYSIRVGDSEFLGMGTVTLEEAREELVEEFDDGNSYPDGRVRLSGPLGTHEFETDGGSWLSEWSLGTAVASGALMVGGVVASATGVGASVGVPMLLAGAGMVAGAASAGFSLAENLTHHDPDELSITIDVVGVVGSLIGLGVAVRGTTVMTRGARYLLITDIGLTGAEGLLIGVQYTSSINQILGSDMSEDEKRAALIRLAAMMIGQGLMYGVATRQNMRDISGSGAPAPHVAGALADAGRSADGLSPRSLEALAGADAAMAGGNPRAAAEALRTSGLDGGEQRAIYDRLGAHYEIDGETLRQNWQEPDPTRVVGLSANPLETGTPREIAGGVLPEERLDGFFEDLRSVGFSESEIAGFPPVVIRRMASADALMATGRQDEALRLLRGLEDHLPLTDQLDYMGVLYARYGIDNPLPAHQERMRELMASGELENSGFHGSSSDLLAGLERTDGRLMSEAELIAEGYGPASTGEGAIYSGRADPKEAISVGMGEAGFGTSTAYAEMVQRSSVYNVQRYTLEELQRHIEDMRRLASMGPEQTGTMMGNLADKAEALLPKLERELELRMQLPPDHPRRLGGSHNMQNYPILFEFDTEGLDVTHAYRQGDALAGEADVRGTIDLRTSIRRVYVPLEMVDNVRTRLSAILGHSDFEVVALDAMDSSLPRGSAAARSRTATIEGLEQNEEMLGAFTDMYLRRDRPGGG